MGRLSLYPHISLTLLLCLVYHFGDCRKIYSQVENKLYLTKQTMSHRKRDSRVGWVAGGDSLWAAL